MAEKRIMTSESVTEGHPDKMCDQISDAILDEALRQDLNSRVAIEAAAKNGGVMVFGEMTTQGWVDVPHITRDVIRQIGYTDSRYGIEWETCSVWTQITEQSPDISIGVSANADLDKEQGAGDQGMMFGFASNETPEFMPLPIMLAHKLSRRLAQARKDGEIPWLRPDGKSQVTVEYDETGRPVRADTVLISTQHDEGITHDEIRRVVIAEIIRPVCKDWLDAESRFFVNPTGYFVRGGPYADSGCTGRKIIVDTYGGMGRHGGGCFSGKDPTKVDRSAAYAARYIAKNVVAAELAQKCEIQLAYAIGVADPVSINIDCFGTNAFPESWITTMVRKHFPLKPAEIQSELDLKRPIYLKTAAYGHFGRDDPDFTWEKTDRVARLKDEVGMLNRSQGVSR